MLSFRDTSIRRKQTVIMMLTSSVVLLLACAAFVAYDVVAFRRELLEHVSVLAGAVGGNCAAAVEFNDPKTAVDTLSALQADPEIIGACIYTKEGEVFAKYDRANDEITFAPPAVVTEGHTFLPQRLILSQPIIEKGEHMGVLYIESDMQVLASRFKRYAGIVGLVFLASLMLAFILSNRLQRLVSDPILKLAEAARSVAVDKNYSVRAPKQNNDEIGQLVDGFNEMLVQIQARDAALNEARDELEHRVLVRTDQLQQEIAERRKTEEEREKFFALIENSSDFIGMATLEGKPFYVNKAGRELVGLEPDADVCSKAITDYCDPPTAALLQNVGIPATFASGHWAGEGKLRHFKNGALTPVHMHSLLVRDPKTLKPICIATIDRNITAIKEAEEKLEKSHRELLGVSRMAGMAEIATNVLHNVGNVLNSVNVSTDLIADSVRKFRASSLARVVALLGEHPHDLGAFISNDPRGKHVPVYLAQLSEDLVADQASLLNELDSLRRNVEHIKEIVAMQQNYARFGGIKEPVRLADLVEDGLRMNEDALSRHHVEIIRELEDVPPLNLEKHKILQILVNLLRNAKHACQESDREDKRITVRLAATNGSVKISVIDNGVGILPENLNRIFNHGFTTRKDGHGFGLHSGALAAKEIGGSLTAQSEGLGSGAAFTLELPRQPFEKSHE